MLRSLGFVLLSLVCSCATAPEVARKPIPSLNSLSLEEKASELFMAWILSHEAGQMEKRAELLALVREGVIGGVILSTGTTPEARDLIQQLQAAAPWPLLIAGDFEAGLAMRLQDAPYLGNAMLLGAAGSNNLAFRVGRATGVEGAALGFHLCFAPVLDVNNNPDNPIINVRSLGEHPGLVARLGSALVRGIEENMIATAKHFPGHGDVDADSHLVLPTVTADADRLRNLELVPFQSAVAAGVSAVMTAHLHVPALDPRPNLPATVSQAILGKVLREKLGFDGLIVTDALEMGGVQKVLPGQAGAVAALAAGADLLLMPTDARAARDAIVAAVRSGKIPMARLDDAVGRLLAAKRRLIKTAPPEPLPARKLQEHRLLGEEVAQRGLTLVRDEASLVPLHDERELFVLDVLDDAPNKAWQSRLVSRLKSEGRTVEQAILHPESDASVVNQALERARSAHTLIVGMHVRVREFSGKIGLPTNLQDVVPILRKHPRAIAIAFGNPYHRLR